MSPIRIRQRVINGYQHIMASPITKSWVLLVIVHFIVQVALQGVTWRDNMEAKLATTFRELPVGIPLLQGGELSMCNGIPGHNGVACIILSSTKGLSSRAEDTTLSGPLVYFDLDAIYNTTMAGNEHFITGRCILSLQWIHSVFRDNASEDIGTLWFQFCLLIVSLSAVLRDSIPHLAICVAGHFLDAGWAGFRMKSTIALQQNYYTFVVDGACGGKDLLGNWWGQRLGHAGPLFGSNVITLILTGALAVILFRRFANSTFGRVGASAPIIRMYKLALAFSAFLQLAAFFSFMAVWIWIDRVSCSEISALVQNIRVYQALFFILAAIIIPWVLSGSWVVFKETKWAFVLFAILHVFPLVLWPTMFANAIYRYIFVTWSFFACVSVTSYLFVLATAVIAIICRMNFGKGLGHFLRVEADLSSSGFPSSVFTNDPAHDRGGSPTSFSFGILDTEKARMGSPGINEEGPIYIHAHTLNPRKYSAHTLSFETSTTVDSESPIKTAFHPPNSGREKPLGVDSKSPPIYLSYTNSNDSDITAFTRKDETWIQPPPDAYLQVPPNETRSRKETPSLITQATYGSANSCSQGVITFASRSPVVSATARTIVTDATPSTRTPSLVDPVTPQEDRPSPDSGTRINFSMVPQRKPTLIKAVDGVQRTTQSAALTSGDIVDGAGRDVPPRVKFPLRPDAYGRV